MDQKWCPVNSFADMSFIIVVYGGYAFIGHWAKLEARLAGSAISRSK